MAPEVVTGTMHVLHVTPYYPPAWAFGDVPRLVERLARAQVARGHQVTVLTTDAMAPHERLPAGQAVIEGVRVVRVRNISGSTRTWLGCSTPIGMRRRARALMADATPSVVHLHEVVTVENLRALPVIPRGIPIVASTHGQFSGTRSVPAGVARSWLAFGGRAALDRVDRIVVSSDDEGADVSSRWPVLFGAPLTRATDTVPDGVDEPAEVSDAERAQMRAGFGAGAGPMIVVAGLAREDRTMSAILDAVSTLSLRLADLHVVFAGADEETASRLRAGAASRGVEGRVHVSPYVAPSRVPPLVSAGELIVLPNPGPEASRFARTAFARRVPVIASTDAVAPELRNGTLRLASRIPSVDQWVDAIGGMLGEPSRRATLVAAGRQVLDASGWPGVAARWDEVYAACGAGVA